MAEQSVLRSGLRLVRELVALHPLPFSVAVTGAAVYAGATVGSTIVLGRLTDDVLYPTFETGEIPSGAFRWGALAVVAMTFLRISGVMARRYFAGMTAERSQRSLRTRLGDKYLSLPMSWHHETPTGQLLAHADSDTEVTTELIHPLPFSLGVVFLAIFSSISLVLIDVWLAFVAFLIFPALTGLNQLYSRRVEVPAAQVQAGVGTVSSIAHESFDGALVVKTLGRAQAEGHRFAEAADTLRARRVVVGYIRAVFEAIMDALPNVGIVVVVVFGAYRIDAGAISRGDLIQVASLFTVLALPMRVLGFFLEMLPPSAVAHRRLQSVFRQPEPDPATTPGRLPDGPLSVQASNLGYAYPVPTEADDTEQSEQPERAARAEPVLTDVDLTINSGEVVALVGSTGSGKSTLCHLLSGLIPPTQGRVQIGGVPLATVADQDRTDAVSLVFQESFLFADTLRANIDLVGDRTQAEIERAADIAQVSRFMADLPDGYDTVVGERGVTLSGGQRQRVALARALIRQPRLLLLDDATSAVDPKIEQQILSGLRSGDATTSLIVAQRVSTIKLADRVLYLSGGRIKGAGRHDELMSLPGYLALVRAYEVANQ